MSLPEHILVLFPTRKCQFERAFNWGNLRHRPINTFRFKQKGTVALFRLLISLLFSLCVAYFGVCLEVPPTELPVDMFIVLSRLITSSHKEEIFLLQKQTWAMSQKSEMQNLFKGNWPQSYFIAPPSYERNCKTRTSFWWKSVNYKGNP